ncbi:MAG: glycosyltransferase family 39 protein [Chloroflexota bacterium]
MSKHRLWLLVIFFIALVIRLHNLTYHSLWFDEAMSVYWARQSVPRILEVGFTLVEDRLPPLYYLSLKGWTTLFGFSETSVRLPSVFYGVLLSPLVAGIAARLFNRRVAGAAALLVALNPFLVWYNQEARMYAAAVFFGTFTVWAFLHLVDIPPKFSQIAIHNSQFTIHYSLFTTLFILSASAALYSHLYAGFLLPALAGWLLIAYPRRRRLWVPLAGGGLVITAAFAPLALAIWRFSGEAAPADAPLAGLAGRAWGLLQAFILWQAPLPPLLGSGILVIVGLLALAAYLDVSPAPRPRYPRLLITLLLLSPFLIAALLLYRNHLAFFGERYFIVMAPWLLLLAAAGADKLGLWLSRFTSRPTPYATLLSHTPLLVLLIAVALPLPGQWSMPAAKEAWRQSVAYLAGHAAADHGILIHPDWVRYPFQFYFRGPGQTYAAFSAVTPATPLDGPLQGVVDGHPVIWLIQSHLDGPDPQRLVERWFAARYPLVTELYPPGISLKGYAPGYQLDHLPPAVQPINIEFDNGMRLVGYQADEIVTARDELFHPPSGWVHVTLYWTAGRPIAVDAAPVVRAIDPAGVWGVSLERPNDALKLFPPTRWSPPTILRHDVDVNLNPLTPPGKYQLLVDLAGQEGALGQVEVR